MDTVYANDTGPAPPIPERRGVSVVGPIDEAKSKITVVELAEQLSGPGQRRGRRDWFKCPLHDDHNPSFSVDPDRNIWFCGPCGIGGDVVELARLAWDYPDDGRGAATAAAMLLLEFGHEVPQRPDSWYARQERQRSVRDRIDAEKIEHIRTLLFRFVWMPWLARLPEWSREEATQSAWSRSLPIARMLYEQRRGA